MKKYLNLFIVFICSFLFLFDNVYADNIGACDGIPVKTEKEYNETGWDAWVNVCDPVCGDSPGAPNPGYKYSQCYGTMGEATSSCRTTYTQSGYKGQYHTAVVGDCSTQLVQSCFACSVQCYKPTGNYYTSGCTESSWNYSYTDDSGETPVHYCKSWSWQTVGPITYTDDGEGLTSDDISTYLEKVEEECGGYQKRNAQCTEQYRVKIPLCTCKSKKYLVKNVREAKYSVIGMDGTTEIPVYCVNPSDLPLTSGANSYTIDATNCSSSNIDLECGYANILIEGYYRYHLKNQTQYNYAVIGAAMRLWGAHYGSSGYDDTGIADEDDTTIDNENNWLKFVPDDETGEYVNVFKETSTYLLEDATANGYRPGIKNYYDIDASYAGGGEIKTITCNNQRLGVFCGTEPSQSYYKYSLLLFLNTVQGNPDMQKHLDEINAAQSENDEIIHNDPTSATVESLDGGKTIRVKYTLRKGVEIDCSTLDEKTFNDVGCYIEQKVVFKTINGDIISEFDAYDYCVKNICVKDIEVVPGTVTCDVTEKITIETETYRNCGEESVKKYVTCGDVDAHQIMFSFEPDKNCDDPVTDEKKTIETELNCDACNNLTTVVKPNCDKSSSSSEDYVERSASDPSLNCILHKSAIASSSDQNSKSYYDYSSMFGVNTNLCRVYCSDKVTYYLASREDVFTSLQLKYDIESRVFPSRTEADKSSHALTSIVTVKRDCVSEIYYDNLTFKDDVGSTYRVSGNPSNWKELYNLLLAKSEKENYRTEVLNELIYDLYSCNFFSDADIKEKTDEIIGKPWNSTNAFSVAKNILSNTVEYCNDVDCVTGSIKYEGGTAYAEPDGEYKYTGTNGKDPALSTEEFVYNGLDIRYCSKDECFRGSGAGENFPEDYSNASKTSAASDTVVFGKNKKSISVPTNDYVIFTYTLEADLYNSTRYQIEEYTGNVKVVKNNQYDENLLTMNKYLYPIAQSVNNRCSYIEDKTSADYGKYICDVKYDFDISVITKYNKLTDGDKASIGTIAFTRNHGIETDQLVSRLEEAENYTCVYSVKRKGDGDGELGFVYRNIDLNNPVPVVRDGTVYDNSNWDVNQSDASYSSYVGKVIQEIEQSGENDLYAFDDYLEYSYELTPEAISSIREYNKTHTYFEKVIKNSCVISDNKLFECRSQFLSDLHTDNNRFGVIINKSDGLSQYTINKRFEEQGGDTE